VTFTDKLDASGIYLCENGLQLTLWVGRQAPAVLVQELFGVLDQNAVTSASTQVQDSRTHVLIKLIRGFREHYVPLNKPCH
jgi:hypothetical protein